MPGEPQIDRVVADIPDAEHGFTLIFSSTPFQDTNIALIGSAQKVAVCADRWLCVPKTSSVLIQAITIIRPETLVRWHRAGFRRYWRLKSRSVGGRTQINADLRALIRRMSIDNVLWGAPRIHGELLKLGFAVAQSTVAKYMARNGDPSDQSWGTFLRNHVPHIAAMDLFVVPTIGFNLLYVLVIVRLARRELVWINVAAHPTAEWIAQQITEAFPWNETPRYLIRDRDGIYGAAVTRRLRAMGIRDKPIAPGLTMAERLCREADRNNPTRVRRPCRRIGRATFAPSLKILCKLL